MSSKKDLMKKELNELIKKGDTLYLSLIKNNYDLSDLSIKEQEIFEGKGKLPNFISEYDCWYTKALIIIKQLIPDRLTDFINQYKNEKRKQIDSLTYTISDYLCGLKTTQYGEVTADGKAAVPKMQNQCNILKAVAQRFDSSLFDIQELIQADLFDSELNAAEELVNKGFVRGGGAIAGVVLEKHLGHICNIHNLKITKKNPTLADYYEILKNNDIIDTPTWRFIQHLGDLRNLCDHSKKKEPTKEEALDLIKGTEKAIKNVW